MSATTGEGDFAEAFWTSARRVFGRHFGGAKLMAQAGGTSVKAAESYLARSRVAGGETMVRLMVASPEFNDAMLAAVRARIAHTENRITECRSRREGARAAAAAVSGGGMAAGMDGGRVRGGGEPSDGGGGTGGAVAVGVDRRRAGA